MQAVFFEAVKHLILVPSMGKMKGIRETEFFEPVLLKNAILKMDPMLAVVPMDHMRPRCNSD